MKLTVKTDRNTLYLSADGNYQEQALHSFPLSACHFGLGHDAGSGHSSSLGIETAPLVFQPGL